MSSESDDVEIIEQKKSNKKDKKKKVESSSSSESSDESSRESKKHKEKKKEKHAKMQKKKKQTRAVSDSESSGESSESDSSSKKRKRNDDESSSKKKKSNENPMTKKGDKKDSKDKKREVEKGKEDDSKKKVEKKPPKNPTKTTEYEDERIKEIKKSWSKDELKIQMMLRDEAYEDYKWRYTHADLKLKEMTKLFYEEKDLVCAQCSTDVSKLDLMKCAPCGHIYCNVCLSKLKAGPEDKRICCVAGCDFPLTRKAQMELLHREIKLNLSFE